MIVRAKRRQAAAPLLARTITFICMISMRWVSKHPLLAVPLVVLLVLAFWAVKLAPVVKSVGASGPAKGYVGLIAQRLRDTTGRPVDVVNLSGRGARIR